jgi:glycosyltransferase involved in cell wall biosynthesis
MSQPHRGQAGSFARNVGIREAQGEYIAFLDSDDLWLPTKLERQIELLDRDLDLAWVYTDAEIFDSETGRLIFRQSKDHKLYEGDVLQPLFIANFIPSVSPMVHRTVFSEVGDFWSTPKLTDWDMWLRVAARYPTKLVPEVLLRQRLHRKRVTDSLSGIEAFEAGLSVIDRAIARTPERLAPLKNQALAQLNLSTGRMLARDGHRAEARKMFVRAIGLSPTSLSGYIHWLGSSFGSSFLQAGIRLRRWVRYQRSING